MASGGAVPLPVLVALLVSATVATSWAVGDVPIVERPITYTSEDHILRGQVALTVTAHLVTQCAQRCELHPACASFNFYQDLDTCELNKVADDDQHPLVPHQGAKFVRKGTYTIDFEEAGACSSHPCENGGWCMETTTQDGAAKALCICKEGYTGLHCTDLVGSLSWSEWAPWGQCSATCGPAWRHRARTCINTLTNAPRTPLDCLGPDLEVEPCSTPECPAWKSWSAWSVCSTHKGCGQGFMTRTRECSNSGQPGVDRLCMGSANQTKICYMPHCDEPLRVAGFSRGVVEMFDRQTATFAPLCADGWTQADADVACRQLGFHKGSVGGLAAVELGVTGNFSFLLSNVNCSGAENTLQECPHSDWDEVVTCAAATAAGVKCIVDGSWNNWSAWGECSVTCADGQRRRSRVCDHPAPAEGGADCAGAFEDFKPCTEDPCPVDGSMWRMWSGWSQCSSSCNGGSRSRTRVCDSSVVLCSGPASEEELCNMVSCAAAAKWTSWAYWSLCDVTCDGGVRRRHRECLEVNNVQLPCTGHNMENQGCSETVCPGSPWRLWEAWSPCSTSCGGGWMSRTRSPVECEGNCEDALQSQSVTCNPHPCPVDGVWLEWSAWTPCNETCGGGWTSRQRSCINPQHGGDSCPGNPTEIKMCNVDPCPVDGYWRPWAEWGGCSLACGGGSQTRARECVMPLHGGTTCDGDGNETRDCNTHNCAENAYWQPWADWSACNVSCGGGASFRTRECVPAKFGGEDCIGDAREQVDCNTHFCPIDCVWQEWAEWETCNVSCNDGFQRRTRTKTDEQHGGLVCEGPPEEWQGCNLRPCPVDGFWEPWAPWSSCDKTCSQGTRNRVRECFVGLHGGQNCTGDGVETEGCFLKECPVDGVWQAWSDWTQCSVTCADGTQTRNRTCEGPFHDGLDCEGSAMETQACNDRPCPVDGVWAAWAEWTRCTKLCGGGTQDRQRGCMGPYHGGLDCPGEGSEQQACNTLDCPENGYWEMWSEWGACTETCGTGSQNRSRVCIPPLHGGETCEGHALERQDCNTHPCPIDGVWLAWSEWGVCNVSCGGGAQRRSRECEPAQYGGEDCQGPREDWQLCNDHPCPVDGYWHEWSDWQTCNTTCGGGYQVRLRQCEPPKFGGNNCEGENEDWQSCNTNHCPVDGYWHEWNHWQTCNQSCGVGHRVRVRDCEPPLYGGNDCEGSDEDWGTCNTHPCPVDSYWYEWGQWQQCNASCGGGMQLRMRECEPAKNGGDTCLGPAEDWRDCNTHHCPVNCAWHEWGAWETCNVTCSAGHRRRMRGRWGEKHGGVPCEGPDDDWQECRPRECPVDCVWESWSAWETCNVTCGLGHQLRRREQQAEQHGGQPCTGPGVSGQDCFPRHCPVDGVWEEWSPWGACPVTCGGSVRLRNRTCDEPQYGGLDCDGPSQESESCGMDPCPIPGDWKPWSAWSACSVSCAGGSRTRQRQCDLDSYGNLTAPCAGNSSDVGLCHDFPCTPHARTCEEWVSRGLVDSVIVDVRPVEQGASFRIRCDVDFESQTGTGFIGHNREGRHLVEGYEGAGEYSTDLTYQDVDGNPLSLSTVITYADLSSDCRQYISWECNAAGIHHPRSVEIQTTYWTNRHDQPATYWGGAEPGTLNCACGMTGTCNDTSKLCNCDMNDNVWRQDDGFLNYRPDLPIHSFKAGDTGREGYEAGYYTIGELICSGPPAPTAAPLA